MWSIAEVFLAWLKLVGIVPFKWDQTEDSAKVGSTKKAVDSKCSKIWCWMWFAVRITCVTYHIVSYKFLPDPQYENFGTLVVPVAAFYFTLIIVPVTFSIHFKYHISAMLHLISSFAFLKNHINQKKTWLQVWVMAPWLMIVATAGVLATLLGHGYHFKNEFHKVGYSFLLHDSYMLVTLASSVYSSFLNQIDMAYGTILDRTRNVSSVFENNLLGHKSDIRLVMPMNLSSERRLLLQVHVFQRKTNNFFSKVIATSFFFLILTQLVSMFWTMLALNNGYLLTASFFFLIVSSIPLSVLILSTSGIEKKRSELIHILTIWREHCPSQQLRHEVTSLAEVVENSPGFRIAGLFNLSKSLIFDIGGFLTMNLVVLMQLWQNELQQANAPQERDQPA